MLKKKEKSHIFDVLCFIFSRKVKTQLKCKNDLYSIWRKICWSSLWSYLSLGYAPWLGRPAEIDGDRDIEKNQCYTMQEEANILKIPKLNTENHLHHLSYAQCFDVWVPHKLSWGVGCRRGNLLDRISANNSLHKHNENVLF